jgi:hypothetical protein
MDPTEPVNVRVVLLPPHKVVRVAAAVPATEVGFTITLTSFETTAPPQVGVEVQTIYHVPTVKSEPVGI